jgi:hypothetical protein
MQKVMHQARDYLRSKYPGMLDEAYVGSVIGDICHNPQNALTPIDDVVEPECDLVSLPQPCIRAFKFTAHIAILLGVRRRSSNQRQRRDERHQMFHV